MTLFHHFVTVTSNPVLNNLNITASTSVEYSRMESTRRKSEFLYRPPISSRKQNRGIFWLAKCEIRFSPFAAYMQAGWNSKAANVIVCKLSRSVYRVISTRDGGGGMRMDQCGTLMQGLDRDVGDRLHITDVKVELLRAGIGRKSGRNCKLLQFWP